ncbi:nucleotide-sugar transporter [Colletotrichum tofieldiae]|uniref:Nucleotide-sugar transporter n=1 Tax=Colletotrichum tofieldiae TaxID=708197 RepID=A0A166MB69_9PEZI|nr:nucleotide-sugar transporter [Colletotrichum tofieldiae]
MAQNAACLMNSVGSKDSGYNPLTAVVFSDVLKLAISYIGLLWALPTEGATPPKYAAGLLSLQKGHHLALIPAILYTVAAVSQATGAHNLSLLPYLMLSQVKLILTPIFGIFFLKQILNPLQWGSLILMTVGVVLVQVGSDTNSLKPSVSVQGQNIALGTFSMVVAGTCVASSGVYTESCLKASSNFLAYNAQLAGYSCGLALLGLILRSETGLKDFFKGYNTFVWVLIVLQAIGGLIVSWCVRITSTVAKNYAQGLGFLAASVISLLSVSSRVEHLFFFGVLLMLWGVFGSLWSARTEKELPSRKREAKEGQEQIV